MGKLYKRKVKKETLKPSTKTFVWKRCLTNKAKNLLRKIKATGGTFKTIDMKGYCDERSNMFDNKFARYVENKLKPTYDYMEDHDDFFLEEDLMEMKNDEFIRAVDDYTTYPLDDDYDYKEKDEMVYAPKKK